MDAPTESPFDSQPHFSDRLRVAFEPMPDAPDASSQMLLQAEARLLLTRLLALDESTAARTEEDKEPNPDLQRLERKLDLVLELLSLRLLDDGSAPPERAVRLSASAACWQADDDRIRDGEFGVLSVYLHRLMPRPLRLPVQVMSLQSQRVQVRFLPLDEESEELLLRYVFLQHRRDLAGHKRTQHRRA